MKVVYKYRLDKLGNNMVEMPLDANVLCVQLQNDIPHTWAEVNPKNQPSSESFEVYMTGEMIPEPGLPWARTYIGTVQMSNGIVLHIYRYKS